jgi:hypothetical protein
MQNGMAIGYMVLLSVIFVYFLYLSYQIIFFEYFYQKEATPKRYEKKCTVTFDEFVKLFSSKKWMIEKQRKYAFFSSSRLDYFDNYIHAGIWAIDNIGILPKNILEFYRIYFWLKKVWKEMNVITE